METPSQPPAGIPVAPSPTSTSSLVALIFGILSLTCCGFLSGIPAIFMGRSEMRAVDQGKIAASNRTIAKVGMILGIIGTILSLGGLLIYAALIAMGIAAGMFQHGMP